MRCRTIWAAICYCFSLTIALTGGRLSADDASAPEPPTFPVSLPIERQVADHLDAIGQAQPAQTVTIIPRASGYLSESPSKAGREVKRGEVLFEIDPRPYQAQLDVAESQLELDEARLKKANADLARAKEQAKALGSIAKLDIDDYQAAEEVAIAAVQAAKANVADRKLNLGFCHVTSPIDGHVGRCDFTPGAMVQKDQTVLATVVSLDSLYVDFRIDEESMRWIRRAAKDGRMKPLEDGAQISVGLEGALDYPYQGATNFVDSHVHIGYSPGRDVRAVVQNPKSSTDGVRPLSPGMGVRIQIVDKPHVALFVAEQAMMGSPTTHPLVYGLYVLDANDLVELRIVEAGARGEDGLREIRAGLKANERVVIDEIRQAQPKTKIRPKLVPMPTSPRADGE